MQKRWGTRAHLVEGEGAVALAGLVTQAQQRAVGHGVGRRAARLQLVQPAERHIEAMHLQIAIPLQPHSASLAVAG